MINNKITYLAAIRMLLSKQGLVGLERKGDLEASLPSDGPELPALGACSEEELQKTILSLTEGPGGIPATIHIGGLGSYRLSAQREGSGRMQHKVVIVTGGAKGFGAGIASAFVREGARVVIADLDEEAGRAFVEQLNAEFAGRACFVRADVADPLSVEGLVEESVLCYGGVDVMISNAGILFAGSLEEMSPEIFEKMTRVNYNGYFNCVRAVAPLMKKQSEFSKDSFFDILQINSKSGLKGSNKNFAYAGAKFGAIGLTQSFALELMPSRIKVNAICPGNFFDGPLWSDPKNGLFTQYLKTGKVPGARTLEDVKRYYEAQVPAGRGCDPMDVARAAFYAIEQEYETGQAIPVTGGQNMLH